MTRSSKTEINSTKNITLDAKHNEISKKFINQKKKIPMREKKLITLKKRYDKLNKIPRKFLTNTQIELKDNLRNEIKNTEKEIKKFNNNIDEFNYFLNTYKLIFLYYENKKPIQNNVIDFFNTTPILNDNTFMGKADIRNDYLKLVDPDYIGDVIIDKSSDICTLCNSEKILIQSEGILVCEKCGIQENIIVDSDKPSYKDPPPEQVFYSYKRLNHWRECLNQVQGKESTEIPQEVFDSILLEIKKERITNMLDVTHKKVRWYLKKLNLNKYYEHIPYIISRLNGKKPPKFSTDIEEKLDKMFREIQEPFSKICPSNRKNFLSYSYVFYKCLELLGRDDLKEYFPLLKSREKLYNQDIMWSKVCKELGYEFYKSI